MEILKNFWVFEGLDGSGTTTQLKNLQMELVRRGISFFSTCEPTEYETGKFLRKILKGEIQIPQSSIAHMFSTDRDNHLFNTKYGIITHLKNNEIVICDRYFFSSLAYQSIGYDYDSVMMLNSKFPYPEKVIFLDTPVDDCIKRIDSRGMAKEIYEKKDYQSKVKSLYEKCFSSLPQGCELIRLDGSLSKEAITNSLIKSLWK